ncbi:30718_t:CDS:2 [Gigaspora margarita]|uniref:30718_t:CDS:1 n=1 Tax=Gigaspora margarita TaxID=4874 RepID=A0ABN7UD36_GIGMA|nr:30718_t:CDS:2 [Gigaspora margarita]
MASTRNPYSNKEKLCNEASNEWKILKNKQPQISLPMNSPSNSSNISEEISEEISYNAAIQKRIIELIQNTNKELDETKKMMVITTNAELKAQFATQINNIQTEINNKKNQLNKLK